MTKMAPFLCILSPTTLVGENTLHDNQAPQTAHAGRPHAIGLLLRNGHGPARMAASRPGPKRRGRTAGPPI